MITRRQLISAALIVVIGLLQAWDSHAFAASRLITGMAVAAVAIPALAALLTTRPAIYWMAIITTGVLAFGAKMVSPTPLPELGLLTLIVALALLAPAMLDRGRQVSAGR
jgi:hypothetical protein